MGSLLAPTWAYALPLAWLIAVTAAGFASWRVPTFLVPVAAAAAAAVNLMVSGPVPAAMSVGLAVVAVAAMLITGTLTRTGLLLWPVLLAGLPVLAWLPALLPGFAAAGVASAIRLRRAAGPGYLSMLAGETFAAVGADQANPTILGVSRPDASRLPVHPPVQAAGVTVRLSGYLAGSVAAAAAASVLAGL